ncbi:hypothetical protein EYR40_009125 [Pleurotus pulmonarius]|nr:hypothetical protein EYR40_009125 [Pleurotus pulmonarius]
MSPPNHTVAKDLENKLFPPAGTSFFESETITVFDEVELTRPSGLGATSHVETLTWRPEGLQSGDDWAYSIGYTQTMTMFGNGGNTATDFEAYYHEDFTRHQSQQTGAETSDGVEFAVHFEENVRYPSDIRYQYSFG